MVDVRRFGARLLPSLQSADVKAGQQKLKMTFHHGAAGRGRRWLTEDCCLVPAAVKCSEMPATERGPVRGVEPVHSRQITPVRACRAAVVFLSLSRSTITGHIWISSDVRLMHQRLL